MQDLCHATHYIRMSSNPTESFLKKFFSAFTFWGCIFSCAFLLFFFAYCFFLFVLIFVCFCCCIVFYCIFSSPEPKAHKVSL